MIAISKQEFNSIKKEMNQCERREKLEIEQIQEEAMAGIERLKRAIKDDYVSHQSE
jgi:hypothetical protein